MDGFVMDDELDLSDPDLPPREAPFGFPEEADLGLTAAGTVAHFPPTNSSADEFIALPEQAVDVGGDGQHANEEGDIFVTATSYQDPKVHSVIEEMLVKYMRHKNAQEPFDALPVHADLDYSTLSLHAAHGERNKRLMKSLIVVDKDAVTPSGCAKSKSWEKPDFPGPSRVRQEARLHGEAVFRRGASNVGDWPFKPWKFELTEEGTGDVWICLTVPFQSSSRRPARKRKAKAKVSPKGAQQDTETRLVSEELMESLVRSMQAQGKLSEGKQQCERFRKAMRGSVETALRACLQHAHGETEWRDRVFRPGYARISLEDFRRSMREEQKLPTMRSEKEVLATGVDPVRDMCGILEAVENLAQHICDRDLAAPPVPAAGATQPAARAAAGGKGKQQQERGGREESEEEEEDDEEASAAPRPETIIEQLPAKVFADAGSFETLALLFAQTARAPRSVWHVALHGIHQHALVNPANLLQHCLLELCDHKPSVQQLAHLRRCVRVRFEREALCECCDVACQRTHSTAGLRSRFVLYLACGSLATAASLAALLQTAIDAAPLDHPELIKRNSLARSLAYLLLPDAAVRVVRPTLRLSSRGKLGKQRGGEEGGAAEREDGEAALSSEEGEGGEEVTEGEEGGEGGEGERDASDADGRGAGGGGRRREAVEVVDGLEEVRAVDESARSSVLAQVAALERGEGEGGGGSERERGAALVAMAEGCVAGGLHASAARVLRQALGVLSGAGDSEAALEARAALLLGQQEQLLQQPRMARQSLARAFGAAVLAGDSALQASACAALALAEERAETIISLLDAGAQMMAAAATSSNHNTELWTRAELPVCRLLARSPGVSPEQRMLFLDRSVALAAETGDVDWVYGGGEQLWRVLVKLNASSASFDRAVAVYEQWSRASWKLARGTWPQAEQEQAKAQEEEPAQQREKQQEQLEPQQQREQEKQVVGSASIDVGMALLQQHRFGSSLARSRWSAPVLAEALALGPAQTAHRGAARKQGALAAAVRWLEELEAQEAAVSELAPLPPALASQLSLPPPPPPAPGSLVSAQAAPPRQSGTAPSDGPARAVQVRQRVLSAGLPLVCWLALRWFLRRLRARLHVRWLGNRWVQSRRVSAFAACVLWAAWVRFWTRSRGPFLGSAQDSGVRERVGTAPNADSSSQPHSGHTRDVNHHPPRDDDNNHHAGPPKGRFDATVVASSPEMHQQSPEVPRQSPELHHPSPELHRLCLRGDIDGVQRLLAAGADVNARVRMECTVGELWQWHPDPDTSGRQSTQTECLPLHTALRGVMESEAGRRGVEVARVLLERGAAVDARDGQGFTPLMLAAVAAHPDAIRLLLRHGADPTTRFPLPPQSLRVPSGYWGELLSVRDLVGRSGPFAPPRTQRQAECQQCVLLLDG